MFSFIKQLWEKPIKKTGFLYDPRFLLHDTGSDHPETAARLEAILKGITDANLTDKIHCIKAVPADLKWVESVHDPSYIRRFQDACPKKLPFFGSQDNVICDDSYNVALLAVGGILNTIDLLMQGDIKNAFCAIRPPGHHAETGAAMGFCYFNNVAIAARYLQRERGLNRIAIIDFDAHHGNGTQQIFEQDSNILYYSIHEHPSFAFPGTGREFEKGVGMGLGFTRNTPVLPGMGDEEYEKLFKRDLSQIFDIFSPEIILVSAGYDAHKDDDMSDMCMTNNGYEILIHHLIQLAAEHCKGRIIFILEGGYCLPRLSELVRMTVEILMEA